MAFDASPSWSGFNYQGKVALYYALKLINAEPVGADLSSYSLILESTEDFEIKHVGEPISFHQVKAYNSSTYSEYSDALLGIALELYKQPGAFGKIHTWKPINAKPSFQDLRASIQDDLRIITTQYQTKTCKDGSTTLEKATSDESKISKQAAILRAAFKGNTADQLYEILASILSGQNDALARLDSYQYDDGNKFCSLDDINTKIKSEISNSLASRNGVITPEHLDKTFHCFLGMIDRHIIHRHKTKQSNTKTPITFQEIVQALEIDHEDVGEEYLACKFKEGFAHLIDDYMGDPEDYNNSSKDEYCNLKEARKLFLGLSATDLWKHYRSFSPQIYLQHDNNTDNAFSANPEGIRHVLIKILHTINFERATHNAPKYKFTYRTTTLPHQHYLPTTITGIARPTQIERKIITNPSMSEILYEVQNLIYDGLEPYPFSPTLAVHTEAPKAEDSDPRSKRDEVLKLITLVPIANAKDALK
ncbi:ABC-three component system protein [Pseudomonas phoenicis]|uniref:ABC-three component system protein n=1 Tax=unclassified Pseudomonas TaxID=196821 RepID=UPI00399FF37D